MLRSTTRRRFLQGAAAIGAAAVLPIRPGRAASANDKVNIASIGCGGQGWADLREIAESPHANVVALCNIDTSQEHLGQAAERFPEAKTFTDWRRLFDELAGQIDAVHVATPDHMHAPVTLAALALGKHVYCQKPLTHTVIEARRVAEAAAKAGVVTQMGNQIQSHEHYRNSVRLIHDGAIGMVREVISWQAGRIQWPYAIDRPSGEDPVPSTVDWNLWLGVAPKRPYKRVVYHSFNWRGWQDFGTGQLGDFGCHILDPVFKALELTAPTMLTAEAPPHNGDAWPGRATVRYEFPATKYTAGQSLKLTWYHGPGNMPDVSEHDALLAGAELPSAGSLFIGEAGGLVLHHFGTPPRLIPEEKFRDYDRPDLGSVSHYTTWVEACRGEGKTTSHFAYAGPLTETVLLGTIALRHPDTEFSWDAQNLNLGGDSEASRMLTKEYRDW
jgi:predicted dehydrogenase